MGTEGYSNPVRDNMHPCVSPRLPGWLLGQGRGGEVQGGAGSGSRGYVRILTAHHLHTPCTNTSVFKGLQDEPGPIPSHAGMVSALDSTDKKRY